MKKLIILLTLALLLSCSVSVDDTEIYSGCKLKFDSPNDVYHYVEYHWIDKEDAYDYWQMPDVSHETFTGDCEDKAVLYLVICKEQFGRAGYIMHETKYEYRDGALILHATAVIDNETYFHIQGRTDYKITDYEKMCYILKNRDWLFRK